MAEPKAAKLAGDWSSRKQRHDADDLKGLPATVQEAILDVERNSHDLAERISLGEELWSDQAAKFPDQDPHDEDSERHHPLALEPGEHNQTSLAYRFEEVGSEIVEIRKDSYDSPLRIIHRPDLKAAEKVDPASALEAKLRGPDADADE